MPGQLFTNYFLEESILHTAARQESLSQPADLDAFRTRALTLLKEAVNFHSINEASTDPGAAPPDTPTPVPLPTLGGSGTDCPPVHLAVAMTTAMGA